MCICTYKHQTMQTIVLKKKGPEYYKERQKAKIKGGPSHPKGMHNEEHICMGFLSITPLTTHRAKLLNV